MDTSTDTPASAENRPGSKWWDTSSVDECRRSFRTSLKVPKPDHAEVLRAWVTYMLTSLLRGTPRAAVAILPALLDRFEKHGQTFCSSSDEMLNAVGAKMLFRAAVALAEYPDISLKTVLRVASAASGACTRCSSADASVALRVALAPRLGNIGNSRGDLDSLEKAWQQEKTQDPPLCRAAIGEIIAEFLLADGEVERAMEFAISAAEEGPCIAPCFLSINSPTLANC
jgi:hypothetical protein